MKQEPPDLNQDDAAPGASAPVPGIGLPGQDLVGLSLRWAKRIIIATIGGTVVLIGVAMLVLPGPAVIVIPLGLAILATEFVWARHWLHKLKSVIPGMNREVPKTDNRAVGSQPTGNQEPESERPTSP